MTMEKGTNAVSVGNLIVAAVGVTASVLFGVWMMNASLRTEIGKVDTTLRTESGKVDTTLRTEIGKVDGNVDGLRDDVREDIGKVDGNVDGLRTDVTQIAEDVGYLRGRMDERDLQRTAD